MENPSLFALHGRALEVAWADGTPRRAVETVLDYHGFAPVASGTARWRLLPDTSAVRPEQALHVAHHETGLSIWRDGDRYFLEHARGTLEVNTTTGHVTGALPDSPEDRISTQLYVVLTFVMLLLFEVDGWYALHAACLVHPSGAGVLLVGPSDSGKSTMALHLVEQGWHYLSDDSVLLHLEGDEVVAHPLRPDFCLDPEAEALFPVLQNPQGRMLTDADKWRVQVDDWYPAQQAASVTPRLVLFPQIVEAPESHAERLRPVEALMLLLPQASLLRRAPDEARQFSDLLRKLVSSAPGYRFLSGADVYRDGHRLAHLLSAFLPTPDAYDPPET